jgi:hypothetical protein
MRRLTTLAMVLVLLGGAAGCGESAAQKEAHRQQAQQTATEHATEAKEQETKREEEAHPEFFSPNSKYAQERTKGEEKKHEAGEPPNAEVAQKDMEAAERVEKAAEGKEPAHTAEWYREQETEISAHEENLTVRAACREKHGPEAEVTEIFVTTTAYKEPEYGVCTLPNGEKWRVKPEAVPLGAKERIPRLYSEG